MIQTPCPAYQADAGVVRALADYVTCQALSIGQGAYGVFAAAGSPMGQALAGMIVIAVALFGYRMMMGEPTGIRDALLLVIRIGVVLTLATQWPAYRVLVQDVAVHGPAEIAATMIGAGGMDMRGDTIDRLQDVHDALVRIGQLPAATAADGAGDNAPTDRDSPDRDVARAAPQAPFLLLISVMGGLVSVRIILAVMLALGPLFSGALLFSATRGLFEGWVRILVAAGLAAIGFSVAAMLELAVLEAMIASIEAAIAEGQPVGSQPDDLLAVVGIFAVAMVAIWIAALAATSRMRLLSRRPGRITAPPADPARPERQPLEQPATAATPPAAMGRAWMIADAAAAASLRARLTVEGVASRPGSGPAGAAGIIATGRANPLPSYGRARLAQAPSIRRRDAR
jgi:type IV secretion system protein VirB6